MLGACLLLCMGAALQLSVPVLRESRERPCSVPTHLALTILKHTHTATHSLTENTATQLAVLAQRGDLSVECRAPKRWLTVARDAPNGTGIENVDDKLFVCVCCAFVSRI